MCSVADDKGGRLGDSDFISDSDYIGFRSRTSSSMVSKSTRPGIQVRTDEQGQFLLEGLKMLPGIRWRLRAACNNALLLGKYWYKVPTDTPARHAPRVVVSPSLPTSSKT